MTKLPEHRGLSSDTIQYACEKNCINYKIIPKETEFVSFANYEYNPKEKNMIELDIPNFIDSKNHQTE